MNHTMLQWIGGAAALTLFISSYSVASAAAPQFFATWRAESFTPSWYAGKTYPTKGTPVRVSFELIDSGKIADLSNTIVRWYVDDTLAKNENDGRGIKTLAFSVPDYAGQETQVRISIPSYRGGDSLNSIVHIPVQSPRIVIDAPYPDRQIAAGDTAFTLVPFFFNISTLDNLTIGWSANGTASQAQGASSAAFTFRLDPKTPSGFGVTLQAAAQNILHELEIASDQIQLTVK